MTIKCKLNPPHLNAFHQKASHGDQVECDQWVAGGFPAGSVVRGKRPTTPKPASGGSARPAASSTPLSEKLSGTAGPAASSSSTSGATAGSPGSESSEKPTLVKKILRQAPRPAAVHGTAPAPTAGVVDSAISEWQLSDEYAAKFWMGIGRLLVWLVVNLMDAFEADEKLTARAQRRVEMSDENCRTLGLFTKEGLTTLFKKLGIKSAERAEQLIDGFGALLIFGALFIGFFKVLWLDLRETPRYKRWKEEQEKGKPAGEPGAARRSWIPRLGFGAGGRGTPAWDAPKAPPGPEPAGAPG